MGGVGDRVGKGKKKSIVPEYGAGYGYGYDMDMDTDAVGASGIWCTVWGYGRQDADVDMEDMQVGDAAGAG